MIESLVRSLYDNYQVRVLVVLVLANFVVASVSALKAGTFSLERVGDVVVKKLGYYLVGYGVAALVAVGLPDWAVVREAAWVGLVASAAGEILRNLRDFGVALPAAR